MATVACWDFHDGKIVGWADSSDGCPFKADRYVASGTGKGACIDSSQ